MSYGTTAFDGRSIRRITVAGSAMDYAKANHKTKEDDEISKEKKRGAIKDAIQTFADNTTAHGIPLFINGTYTLARIAWALLWLVAIGVAFVQAYSLLYEYFVIWPTTTNIELVTNTNSKFPAVTVCNMNRIRRSQVVGTRFEGLVAIDGGVSGGDYDYSWFFDWSSNWFNDWTSSYSSSSDGVGFGGGTGASSDGETGVGSSGGTGAGGDGETGVGSSGGTGAGSDGGTGVGSSGGTGAGSDGGTGVGSSGGTGLTSGLTSIDGTGSSVGGGDASSAGTGANTGSSVGTEASADTGLSAGNQGSIVGGVSSFVDPSTSMTTDDNSFAETTVDTSEGNTGNMSSVDGSLGGSSVSTTNTIGTSTDTSSTGTATVTPESDISSSSGANTMEIGSSTTSEGTTTSVSSDGGAVTDASEATTVANEAATLDTITTTSYLSAAATVSSSTISSGSASSDLDKRKRRSLGSSSSSSSSFNLFGSSNSDLDFQYYDYYNWDDVADENDWQGFYEKSTADDFSDLVDVVNPTRDELETLGHQAQNFILQCTFDKKKCNYTNFRVTQNKDYGNCFTFNHGTGNDTVRYTSKSGAKYGLQLTIWIEQPEYIGILTPESGARLTVHDQRTMPTPEDEGITVAPGMATSIGVRQDYIERQPHPFGNCSTDSSQTDFPGNDYYDYSVGACAKYCLQNAMLRRCGCVTDLLIDSAAKCSYINSTQQMCRQAVDALYESNRLNCKCPTACNETTYRLGISSSRWPSERYEEHLHARVSQTNANAARLLLNAEQTKKNVLRLRVYFEELNYQSIIQSPKYSIEGLLGALGGLFGLYVGFSVITMAEAFVFIVKLIKIVLCIGPKCKSEVRPTA